MTTQTQLSVPEVAARWSVSAKTVWRLVWRGELKANRIGVKIIRVPLAEVERYERSRPAA